MCFPLDSLACAHALRRAVAHFSTLRRVAVNLHEHRVIHVRAEGVFDGTEIRLVSVRRELHAIREPVCEIVNEMVCGPGIAGADEPARHEFRLRVNRRPRPAIAPAIFLLLIASVLLFRPDESPNLIALNPLAREIAKRAVLKRGASRPHVHEKFGNGFLRRSRHAARSAHAVSFDHTSDDARAFCGAQFVHNEYAYTSKHRDAQQHFSKGRKFLLRLKKQGAT